MTKPHLHSHGWIGVDLDGTLAHYTGWISKDHIGDPVPLMAARVKAWLAEGRDVRIFTARMAECSLDEEVDVLNTIEAWTLRHFGQKLPITCQKNRSMVELWDDRVVQVEPNTGRRIDEVATASQDYLVRANKCVHAIAYVAGLLGMNPDDFDPERVRLAVRDLITKKNERGT